MCGICGTITISGSARVDVQLLKKRTLALKHRGPDGFGVFHDGRVGLGHARLSIVDLSGGSQPIANEDKSIWIVYNGEVFNYPELRRELQERGHVFRTRTDTEVLVHLYEEKGESFVRELNGQFAFALWDAKRERLMLGRDRLGVRPLFYTVSRGQLSFASEIKSILVDRSVSAELDPRGLDQLFTFWATIPPTTVFKDIREVPPAHCLVIEDGNIRQERYWDPDFSVRMDGADEERCAAELHDLLLDAARIRLRADVPVAAYVSGGLDSSFIASLVRTHCTNELRTFSIAFADAGYDESGYQKKVAEHLGTRHSVITCTHADIGRVMPSVVWHAEKPLLRTAPAPMFLLSQLVRDSGMKVVLTGEGADEVLGGYDLFKEMKIRRFWAREPASRFRPRLFRRLYQDVSNWSRTAPAFLEAFYRSHLSGTDADWYSHLPRWSTTAFIKTFYSRPLQDSLRSYDATAAFREQFPARFPAWGDLAKAQYIEAATILSGNLLSSQGDRMAMAHSVEGRYPFLDHRVVEFCSSLPPRLKLRVLNEKYLLKKVARPYLPGSITKRVKQAYRAPDAQSFLQGDTLPYVDELLSPAALSRSGYFDPAAVERLVARCRNSDPATLGNRYHMAVTAIITTQLVDELFVRRFDPGSPQDENRVQVVN